MTLLLELCLTTFLPCPQSTLYTAPKYSSTNQTLTGVCKALNNPILTVPLRPSSLFFFCATQDTLWCVYNTQAKIPSQWNFDLFISKLLTPSFRVLSSRKTETLGLVPSCQLFYPHYLPSDWQGMLAQSRGEWVEAIGRDPWLCYTSKDHFLRPQRACTPIIRWTSLHYINQILKYLKYFKWGNYTSNLGFFFSAL